MPYTQAQRCRGQTAPGHSPSQMRALQGQRELGTQLLPAVRGCWDDESCQSSSLRAAFSPITSAKKNPHNLSPGPEGLRYFSDYLQMGLVLLKNCWCFLQPPHKDGLASGTGTSEGSLHRVLNTAEFQDHF